MSTSKELTPEQFARWSFERDKKVGLLDEDRFEDMPMDDREAYLQEAVYYIEEVPQSDWPIDILERL